MSIRSDAAPVHTPLPLGQDDIGPDTLVGDVLGRHPQTAPVIGAYGLDACCGASKTLEIAASAHGIALPELIAALQDAARSRA